MSPCRVSAWAILALIAAPAALLAQEPDAELDEDGQVRLYGTVIDRSTGEPVPAARVTLTSLAEQGSETWVGLTGSEGFFDTGQIPIGGYRLDVEALLFAPLTEPVVFTEPGLVDLDVEMVPVDYELPPVVVFARRETRLERSGFFERRQALAGTFLTREEIMAQNPQQVSDIFRTMPGVTVSAGNLGYGGDVRLRRGCTPQIILDGVRMLPPVRLDDVASPGDLEAIEVHRGLSGPAQFQGSNACGQILLWTRSPGEGGQTLGSLLKVMGAAAFIVIAVLTTN